MSIGGVKLALCGGIRSGKDTVGEQLVVNHGFKRFAFGDGIREVCWNLFPERMEAGKDRALLQGVGQDLRKYDPDIWVKWILAEIGSADYESWLDDPSHDMGSMNVVITDLRQPNEYKALREAGYMIVRVNASEDVRLARARAAGDVFDPSMFHHDTESHYSSWTVDYEIDNEGTFAEFMQQIQKFIDYISPGGDR
jgi:dephospho-CoA kinase